MEYDRSHKWSSCSFCLVCFLGQRLSELWGVTLKTVCNHGVETYGNKPRGLTLYRDLASLADLCIAHAFAFSWLIMTDIFVRLYWFQMLNKVRSLSHKMRWWWDCLLDRSVASGTELSWTPIWNERAWAYTQHHLLCTITRSIFICILNAIICNFAQYRN